MGNGEIKHIGVMEMDGLEYSLSLENQTMLSSSSIDARRGSGKHDFFKSIIPDSSHHFEIGLEHEQQKVDIEELFQSSYFKSMECYRYDRISFNSNQFQTKCCQLVWWSYLIGSTHANICISNDGEILDEATENNFF